MTELRQFKQEVGDHLKMAQDYLRGDIKELPHSNLFWSLVDPEKRYNPFYAQYDHARIANERVVEMADIRSILGPGSEDAEAIIARAEPMQCFKNT